MTTCSIEGCDRTAIARGWCSTHYSRWRFNGDPLEAREYDSTRKCKVEGCTLPHSSRGWCRKHYKRWEKTGEVERERDGKGRAPSPDCEFPGCKAKSFTHGLCQRHWRNVERHGHDLATARSKDHPASPAIWADLRAARTMRELGRRKDVDFYLARAAEHGRPLTRLELEFVDGVRMEPDRDRDQAVLAADVAELTGKGLGAEKIGRLIGVSDKTVVRKRAALGITQPTWNQSKE